MKLKLSALLIFALHLAAQSIPNGTIYQAATANGIAYISPASGAQILAQKAGANWKSILNTGIQGGSIAGVIAGATGLISMSHVWIAGIAIAHDAWDQWGAGVLQNAAPNPTLIISSLLQPAQTTTLSGQCVEASIFAQLSKKAIPVGPINVGSTAVTFSPEGPTVILNAAGSRIKDFGVWDVLICPWIIAVPPVPVQLREPGE